MLRWIDSTSDTHVDLHIPGTDKEHIEIYLSGMARLRSVWSRRGNGSEEYVYEALEPRIVSSRLIQPKTAKIAAMLESPA